MSAMREVENVNTPGRTNRVNAAKYDDMRRAMETALPHAAPGLPSRSTPHSVPRIGWMPTV